MTDIVTPPLIDPLPPPPQATDTPTQFDAKAYATLNAQAAMVSQINATAAATRTNAIAAQERAAAALSSASDAAAARDEAVPAAHTAVSMAESATNAAFQAHSSRAQAAALNLGPHPTEPTTDGEGLPLRQGATYWDTTLNKWRVWTGAAWGDGISAVAGVSSVNGQTGDVTVQERPFVMRPFNLSPHPVNDPPAGARPTLTGSPYYALYGALQDGLQVQVATSANFVADKIYDSGTLPPGVSHTLPLGVLVASTTYHWRLRYRGMAQWSEWSEPSTFATGVNLEEYRPTPAATPANFGDPFEGGFYGGMIWGEIAQSATSTAIATGSKTFTIQDTTGSPIVYMGQQLEVRSRANPANKMIGTVTFAGGTQLTINVASVGGSGTFADWSVMSRYRVIVAPKASGENANVQIKNAQTALPVACRTITEGGRATQAMRDADTSTVYPAAHWARSLNIGGQTDWYIPARDELELMWRNLKPVTNSNYVTADRPNSSTYDYKANGAYGGSSTSHGMNDNSAPPGAAYTSGAPAQVVASAFRTGGSEALEFGSAFYWSSSAYSGALSWQAQLLTSLPGRQAVNYHDSFARARAVRRSII